VYEDRPVHTSRHAKRKRLLKRIMNITGGVLVALAVFGLGLGVGNGTIDFSRTGSQNKALPEQLDYATINEVYRELKSKYDGKLSEEQLLDGLKAGLAQATGDPYTVYLNGDQAKDFKEQLSGTFSGIGAELGKDPQSNLIIVAPIEGTPASKAGLRPQDVIVGINDKDTVGMTVEEAVTKIRGDKGTKVKLQIIRDKKDELDFTITRDDITVPSVKSEILAGNIGYMRITQFNEDTPKLATKAAEDFKNHGVKGVLLDLRSNPGGTVEDAVKVTSMWLPEGKPVLIEKRGNVAVATELSNGLAPLLGVRTAVLINEGSASAAEITAGALKDHKVATIFGSKSFGKGSVQQLVQLPDGETLLKVTMARWYRPNGQNIDKKGITPDKEIKMTAEDYEQKRDPQKDAALEFLQK
jgi:carboxyl-terminal processing protease